MNQSVILKVEGLCYHYRDPWTARRFDAVKDISFEILEGESFGFLGHNGAGKTTTIKCLLNLIRLKSGKIEIFGNPHYSVEQRRLIGYLPEHPYFYEHLTVREIMEMYAALSGIGSSYRERKEAVFEAIELVHLTNRLDARMRSLSKGLTQRVAMAQAIVSKPKLLILDEPFSGLDPIGRKQFRDLMVELRSLGTTILLCSHILSDVEFFCDRASIMSNGVLKGVFDIKGIKGAGAGKFELVVRQYENVQDELSQHALGIESRTDPLGELSKFTYSDRAIAQHALSVAVSKGAIVDSFQFVNDSLEDLFVKLVGQAGADL